MELLRTDLINIIKRSKNPKVITYTVMIQSIRTDRLGQRAHCTETSLALYIL